MRGMPRQVQKGQKAVPFGFYFSPPVRDGGKGCTIPCCVRPPAFQRHTGRSVMPLDSCIGKPCSSLTYSLANREIHIVWRHADTPFCHPNLCQTEVDVHDRGVPEPSNQLGASRVIPHVQEKIHPDRINPIISCHPSIASGTKSH